MMKKWQDIKRSGNASTERGFRTAATTSTWLAELRRQASVTQVELAKRLGVSQSWISQIEAETDIRVSTIAAFVAALGGKLQFTAILPAGQAINLNEMPAPEPDAVTRAAAKSM